MTHKNILIIEDEEIISENLRLYFEDEGFLVKCAKNSIDTVQLLKETSFAVAIVDMRLPDSDGNSIILKAYELQPHIKFIIHTGSASYSLPPSLKAIGIEQKCIFYKPVMNISRIHDMINELIAP